MTKQNWWSIAILTMAAVTSMPAQDDAAMAQLRASQFANGFGTYGGEPRLASGRVDIGRLLRELADIRATAYSFLIWRAPTDWEDLHLFLPKARAQGLKVWVTVVPPSESPPKNTRFSEPFRLDYQKWAEELAKLSVAEPNLVGWSIDDFVWNTKVLTAEKMGAAVRAARAINPRLAFFPCCYFRAVTPEFARDFGPIIDGIFFPYRAESTKANLVEAGPVEDEVRILRERLGPARPVIFMFYATAHSRLGASTNAYVDAVMQSGRKAADGVIVYVHQDPQKFPEKYETIRRLFREWDAETPRAK